MNGLNYSRYNYSCIKVKQMVKQFNVYAILQKRGVAATRGRGSGGIRGAVNNEFSSSTDISSIVCALGMCVRTIYSTIVYYNDIVMHAGTFRKYFHDVHSSLRKNIRPN